MNNDLKTKVHSKKSKPKSKQTKHDLKVYANQLEDALTKVKKQYDEL